MTSGLWVLVGFVAVLVAVAAFLAFGWWQHKRDARAEVEHLER